MNYMKKLYDYAIGTKVMLIPSDEPNVVYTGSIQEDDEFNRYIHCDDGDVYYPDNTDIVKI